MSGTMSVTFGVAALLVAPSLVTVGLSKVTSDPHYRPFSVTEETLAAAEFLSDEPVVRVRIYWRGAVRGFNSADILADAVRDAFFAKGVESQIAILYRDGDGPTTLDMRAGRNAFGPFPVSQAAQHISPAVEAVRVARKQYEATRQHRW
jgi:hypothetical protein